jgi:hypothetical protein
MIQVWGTFLKATTFQVTFGTFDLSRGSRYGTGLMSFVHMGNDSSD